MRKSIAVLITFFMMMSLCACSLSDVKDLIVPGQSTKTQSVILEPGQKDATKNKPIDADDDEKDDTDPKNSRSKSKGTSIQNIFTAENEMTEVMTYLRDSKGTDISQLKWFRFYQVIIDDYQVFTIVQYRSHKEKEFSYLAYLSYYGPNQFFFDERTFYECTCSEPLGDANNQYYDVEISVGSKSLHTYLIMDSNNYVTRMMFQNTSQIHLAKYTYDKNNIIETEMGSKYEYISDDSDIYSIMNEDIESWSECSGNMKFTYTYEDAGYLTNMVQEDRIWDESYEYEFTYNEDGFREKEEAFYEGYGSRYSYYEIEFERDEEGFLTKVTYEDDYSGYSFDMSYDSKGRLRIDSIEVE